MRIDGTRVKEWLLCPRLPFLAEHESPDRQLATTPRSEILFAAGRAVEARLLADFAPTIVEYPKGDFVAGFAATRRLLDANTRAIAGAVLVDGQCLGRPDLLLLSSDGERYEVADVKAARRARASARLQVALYGRILAKVAKVAPVGHIVLHDGSRESFALAELDASLDHVIARIAADVDPGAHRIEACGDCRFRDSCLPALEAQDDVALIPSLTRAQAAALRAAGCGRLDAIVAAEATVVAERTGLPVDLTRRLHNLSRAVTAREPIRLSATRPEIASARMALAALSEDHDGPGIAVAGVVLGDPRKFRSRFLRSPEASDPGAELRALVHNLAGTKGPILVYGSVVARILSRHDPQSAREAGEHHALESRLIDLRSELRRAVALPDFDRTPVLAARALGITRFDDAPDLLALRYLCGEPGIGGEVVASLLRRDLSAIAAIRHWLTAGADA